jgi:hypothetical protein
MLKTRENYKAERWVAGLMTAAVLLLATVSAQEAGQKTYTTPKDASKALYDAVKSGDKAAMEAVLGASSQPILSSGDPVQDQKNADFFTQHYELMNRWGKETTGELTLFMGAENWPMPVPLKKNVAGQWYFDSKAGVEEVLYRRIGHNELAAIKVCQALSDAQVDYFADLHDGDTVHQYAQKWISDEGKQNGLYWPTAENDPPSPIGPVFKYAANEGYTKKGDPFHGYYFRLLTAQGPAAPGGAKSYIVEGKMTGGYAFLAYPAEYKNSGVMTFIVNLNGVVYEKNLGPKTEEAAKAITAINPDATWRTVGEDSLINAADQDDQ